MAQRYEPLELFDMIVPDMPFAMKLNPTIEERDDGTALRFAVYNAIAGQPAHQAVTALLDALGSLVGVVAANEAEFRRAIEAIGSDLLTVGGERGMMLLHMKAVFREARGSIQR